MTMPVSATSLFASLSNRVDATIDRVLVEKRIVGSVAQDGEIVHRRATDLADWEANPR